MHPKSDIKIDPERQHKNSDTNKKDIFDYFDIDNNKSWQQTEPESIYTQPKNNKSPSKRGGIFNLFGLINNKGESDIVENKILQSSAKSSVIVANKKQIMTKDENEECRFEDKFLEEEDQSKFDDNIVDRNNEEDNDLLNVPAFFRRKK